MPDFPPLFDGRAVAETPLDAAVAAAKGGCDAGLLLYRPSAALVEAALVLAPEVPLADAAAMVLVAGIGFADAFGALSPPEMAFHLEWPDGLRLEGARCGGVRAAAPPCADAEVPDWLVVGVSVVLARDREGEPGEQPDETDLRSEGVDLGPDEILSAWARHTMSWIARWEDEAMAPVHREWTGRAWGMGKPVSLETAAGSRRGIFQGLDEQGGMLLKGDEGITLVPLTEMLERR